MKLRSVGLASESCSFSNARWFVIPGCVGDLKALELRHLFHLHGRTSQFNPPESINHFVLTWMRPTDVAVFLTAQPLSFLIKIDRWLLGVYLNHHSQPVFIEHYSDLAIMISLARIKRDADLPFQKFLSNTEESESVGDFVLLYGQSIIEERNQTYQLEQYLPGWFTIGDDSAGTALLMKLDRTDGVYQCGHGTIGATKPALVASTFREWYDEECPTPWNED